MFEVISAYGMIAPVTRDSKSGLILFCLLACTTNLNVRGHEIIPFAVDRAVLLPEQD